MIRYKSALIVLCIFIAGCTSNITIEKATTIAQDYFVENSPDSNSYYTVQTSASEVYSVTEKGEHIPCYDVSFVDENDVLIATYFISKKDGEILQKLSK